MGATGAALWRGKGGGAGGGGAVVSTVRALPVRKEDSDREDGLGLGRE